MTGDFENGELIQGESSGGEAASVAATRIRMADISGQRRFEFNLRGDSPLTPDHSVSQALDHYLETSQIPANGLRWNAFSRGMRLDNKSLLKELPAADTEWTVMPEVSAGSEMRDG